MRIKLTNDKPRGQDLWQDSSIKPFKCIRQLVSL